MKGPKKRIEETTPGPHRLADLFHRWMRIFEDADWGVAMGNSEGRFIGRVNSAFARMYGHTMEEMIGKPIAAVFSPEYRAELPYHIRQIHEKGHHTFRSVHIRKDRSRFPVLVDAMAVKDENGNVLFRLVNVQDVS